MPQGVQAGYSYDAGGRRVGRTITINGQARTTQYVYEGQQAIGEIRDNRIAATLLTGIGLDDVIARIVSRPNEAGAVKTHITDALGSVLAITRADQGVEAGYAYSPYGETTPLGTEASENALQYTGRENDEGTGLYFYRARYYDPVVGRFISRDPIGLAGGANEYAYVAGGPLDFTDPNGLNPAAGALNGGRLGAAAGSAFGPVGTVVGGLLGAGAGAAVGWLVTGPMFQEKTPNTGEPGSWHTNPGDGQPGSGQERQYGANGKPEVDIDWHPDHGAGKPHGHNWDNGRRGPGVPLSPWPRGRIINGCQAQ